MSKKITGKAVLGSWGVTMVVTDLQFDQVKFDKEVRRIRRLGFHAGIVDVKIELIFKK